MCFLLHRSISLYGPMTDENGLNKEKLQNSVPQMLEMYTFCLCFKQFVTSFVLSKSHKNFQSSNVIAYPPTLSSYLIRYLFYTIQIQLLSLLYSCLCLITLLLLILPPLIIVYSTQIIVLDKLFDLTF